MNLSIEGGIAELGISGPIDLDWATGLRDHAATLAQRDDVRVVRISAEGRFFCPGGDLAWMQAQPDPGEAVFGLASTLHEGLLGLAALDAPVVARVHGAAAGAGMSLVLGADFAIAGASASFMMAYMGVGLSPDGGASFWLPRIVGHRRAAEIIMLNRPIPADEAAALGLVTSTVPDDELDAAVDALVAKLAAGPTASYGAAKRLLQGAAQATYAEQLSAEAQSIRRLAGSPTGQEGIAAFLAKRKPQFP